MPNARKIYWMVFPVLFLLSCAKIMSLFAPDPEKDPLACALFIVQGTPQSLSLHAIATNLARAGRYQEAVGIIKSLDDKVKSSAFMSVAVPMLRKGLYDDALRLLGPTTQGSIGDTLFKINEEERLRQILDSDPGFILSQQKPVEKIFLKLGQLKYLKSDVAFKKALQGDFDNAAMILPDDSPHRDLLLAAIAKGNRVHVVNFARTLKNLNERISLLVYLADADASEGDVSHAEELLKSCLQLAQPVEDPLLKASCYVKISGGYQPFKPHKAALLMSQAQDLSAQVILKKIDRKKLHSLGGLWGIGFHKEAMNEIEAAMNSLMEETHHPSNVRNSLDYLAKSAAHRGQLEYALRIARIPGASGLNVDLAWECFQRHRLDLVEKILKIMPPSDSEVSILNLLALKDYTLGRPDRALNYLAREDKIMKSPRSLAASAETWARVGRKDVAQALFVKALEAAEKINWPNERAEALSEIGWRYAESRLPVTDEAQKVLKRIVKWRKSGEDEKKGNRVI